MFRAMAAEVWWVLISTLRFQGFGGLFFVSQALDLLFGCIFLQPTYMGQCLGVLNPVFQLRRVGIWPLIYTYPLSTNLYCHPTECSNSTTGKKFLQPTCSKCIICMKNKFYIQINVYKFIYLLVGQGRYRVPQSRILKILITPQYQPPGSNLRTPLCSAPLN